jgi:intracellular sulfur oxidation DsrE/DsrF family protein
MTDHTDGRPSGRREFLSQLAVAGLVVSGTACVAPSAHALQTLPTPGGTGHSDTWDDSWTQRVRNHESVVFDIPEFEAGAQLSRAAMVMGNYKEALDYGDDRLTTVLVIRHAAIPLAFNDALWEKYEIGKAAKINDPATGEPARRNPFLRVNAGDKNNTIEPSESLIALHARGVILLGCNRAAMARAESYAKKTGVPVADVQQEIRTNLVPGVTLQPSGVYAVVRAQNAGAALFR